MTLTIKTSHWFAKLPPGHQRIGISRGTPRGAGAGYRLYRTLAPGPWFHSVGPDEYYQLYRREVLAPLDPRLVVDELATLAGPDVAVLLCFCRPGAWCHRAMAAEWLHQELGLVVPEVGHERCGCDAHPLMPALSARPAAPPAPDLSGYVGLARRVGEHTYRVDRLDPAHPGRVIMVADGADGGEFSTGADSLRHHFPDARPPR